MDPAPIEQPQSETYDKLFGKDPPPELSVPDDSVRSYGRLFGYPPQYPEVRASILAPREILHPTKIHEIVPQHYYLQPTRNLHNKK